MRFGIDAPATAQTGDSRIAVIDAIATSWPGVRANARATNPAAAHRSEITSTRRRSNRSPSQLAKGCTRPCTPIVSSRVTESQIAELVRQAVDDVGEHRERGPAAGERDASRNRDPPYR